MAQIFQLPTLLPGTPGINPSIKYMQVGDNLAALTTAGYLNQVNLESAPLNPNDTLFVQYSFNPVTGTGTFGIFSVGISGGVITLSAVGGSGSSVTLPTVANAIAGFTNTAGNLSDNLSLMTTSGGIQAGTTLSAGTTVTAGTDLIAGAAAGNGFVEIIQNSAPVSGTFRINAQANTNSANYNLQNPSVSANTVATFAVPGGANNTIPAFNPAGNNLSNQFLAAIDNNGLITNPVHINFMFVTFGGGSTSQVVPLVNGSSTGIVVGTVNQSTNPAYIVKIDQAGGNGFTVTYSADPGANTVISIMYAGAPFGPT